MTYLPECRKTDGVRYRYGNREKNGKAKKMRRNCTDGKRKEFMHDFETTT